VDISFWSIAWLINYGLVLITIVIILLRRHKEPAAMVAWILTAILIPFVGWLLYLLIGETRVVRLRRRQRRRRAITPALARQVSALAPMHVHQQQIDLDAYMIDLIRIATRVGDHPPTRGNDVTIYHDAEKTFRDLGLAIESARSHVHMEYYIFQPDGTGRAIRDLLVRKAREGVRCRLLLDAVGSWALPRDFMHTFRDAGVELEFFLPVKLKARKLHLNLRNHRKLVVVDGGVGFTGSQNVGDEYIGRRRKYGPWRDTHLRVVGPAAAQLQEVFVEDWHFATNRDLSGDDSLFPSLAPAGSTVVQIMASGPDRAYGALYMLLLSALACARTSVAVMTPYFVPDLAMAMALKAAALRGVRVQLLLPSRSDAPLALWAGRSYYDELLESGVEIFEFSDGMLHSKVVVIDEKWAMVSSANMDVRSFRLNFELSALLYDRPHSQALFAEFAAIRNQASRITIATAPARWGIPASLLVGLARLAAPLL